MTSCLDVVAGCSFCNSQRLEHNYIFLKIHGQTVNVELPTAVQ